VANLRTRRPRLDADSFIAGAEAAPPEPEPTAAVAPARRETAPAAKRPPRAKAGQGRGGGPQPWEAPSVRADVTKAFNLRLPEPLKLKLDFIRERTRVSVHEFIMTALAPAVDREIERLTRERE
jgi:hypothetical protein